MKNTKSIKQRTKFFAFGLRLFRIKSLSVYQLTLGILIITAILSVVFIFAGWAYTETLRVKTKIKELKETSLNKQEEKLKIEVSRLIFYLEYIQQDTTHHTLEQIQNKALQYFENLRFGNDGYVFVNTYDGIALLFDGQRLAKTKNITELTDPNGFKIFERELELAKLSNGGSFQYLFKKIYDAIPQPKLSYVMGFDEWQWIIGTGDYLDNIEAEVSLLEQGLKRDMYSYILIAFGLFASVLILLILSASWFASWVQHQFTEFVLILKQASLGQHNEQPLDRIFIQELKIIGHEIFQAEQAVKAEHARFKNIMDINPFGIYIVDKQHNIEYINPVIEKEFGSIEGRKCYAYFHGLSEECAWCKNKDVFAGKSVRWEWFSEKNNKHYDLFDTLLKNPDGTASKFELFLDITERKEAEAQLYLSQQRYSGLFENAPISLWEEDFSDVIEYLDEQTKHYRIDIEQLFEQYPEALLQCADLIKITDVNKQTLNLFQAQNKEDLLGNLNKLFTEVSLQTLKHSLFSLYRGDKEYSSISENLTLKGKKLDVLFRWSFLPSGEERTRKVIISIVDLTILRKKEKDLYASESRFRSVFENNHTVMFLINAENGRFIDANPAALKFYGYTHEHFVTKLSVYDLNTLSKEETIAKINEAKAKKQVVFNFKHRLSNGEIRDVEVHSGIIQFEGKPTLFSFVHDVTEKQRIGNALRKSEESLKEAQRIAKIGNWELDLITNKLHWSDEVYRLFDLEPQQFGATYEAFLDNIHPDDRELVNNAYTESLKAKAPYDIVHRLLLKDGAVKFVHENCETFYEDGKAVRSVGTVQDITDRKLVEDELEMYRNHLETIVNDRTSALEESQDALLNLVDDLNRQSVKLEKTNIRFAEINKELETFTYSVSHDLKAPLRGIDGYSQLLQDSYSKELDTEAQEFLVNIRKSTQQMNLLIEDLLSYSRMERQVFQNEEIQLKALIDNLFGFYSKTNTENNIVFSNNIPLTYTLAADKDGLSLVLRNLVDNAIKFSSQNSNSSIEIGCSESNTHWRIFVKDKGIGFDMKYHDRIFKIFQRLHLAEEYDGTGIGLAMVEKAMQRMNGKVWAESELGKGSCFYVEISK